MKYQVGDLFLNKSNNLMYVTELMDIQPHGEHKEWYRIKVVGNDTNGTPYSDSEIDYVVQHGHWKAYRVK